MNDLVIGKDGLARPPWAATDPLLREYYDTEWGVPVTDERGVFERLCLEGFQAGLSWRTVLAKRPAFREAFHHFEVDRVAAMTDRDIERLLTDPGIIRSRAKIAATIGNARETQAMRADQDLVSVIWSHQPERTPCPLNQAQVPTQSPQSRELARDLKRRGFRFVGPTTMFALMEAIGVVDTHVVGTHRRGCSGLWEPTGERRRNR